MHLATVEEELGMQCDRCDSEQFTRAGQERQGRRVFRCRACGRRRTTRSSSAFSGYTAFPTK